ncbi:MAG: hypothetical protein RMN52_14650 [Anaerolineae bacterium]|nr:hypothetical protein [Candidatus Roseilinea sp.]MDW8451237.1 hypothetical protein [Anaerolineae bacterium]
MPSPSPSPPPPLPPPTANVLWVAPDGRDDPARGSANAPLRTLAHACARAQAGFTIRLTAGEFRETAQCALRWGVRVRGNGRAGASCTVIHAPASWDFRGDGVADNDAGYVILAKDVQNVTVDGIAFFGNANRANGALRIINAQTVVLRDLSVFDMKNGTYSMEVGTDKMAVDHNWFRNTWTALQNYGDQSTRIRDLTVFSNVVENISMRFIGLKGRVENLRVFGNTVYLGPGGGQSYFVTLGRNNGSRNWLIANNVIVGSPANPVSSRQLVVAYESATAPRDVQVRNNVYRDIGLNVVIGDAPADPATYNLQFVNNLNADPSLPTTGSEAFQPPANSPVIDRGDPAIGVRSTFIGAGATSARSSAASRPGAPARARPPASPTCGRRRPRCVRKPSWMQLTWI